MTSSFFQQFQQAKYFKEQKKYEAALSILHQLAQTHPQHAVIFNQLGTIYFAQHHFHKACQMFQTAGLLEPNLIEAHYNLGLVLSKLGEKSQAITAYQKVLAYEERHEATHFQLGCLFVDQNQYELAISHFNQVTATEDRGFELNMNLAHCFLKINNWEEAKKHYLNAYVLCSNDLQVLFNLGVVTTKLNQVQEAAHYYHLLLHHSPLHFEAHYNLGLLYKTEHQTRNALHHFHAALRIRPQDEKIEYLITTLTGSSPEQAPPAKYIQALFDAYASDYDKTLTHDLEYQVPHLMFAAWDQLIQKKNKSNAILDLGCGTGLCGEFFKPWATHLTGVDLSSAMLNKLAQKELYDHLIQADIQEFLLQTKQKYDLVLMGDVLVYFSEISDLFKAIKSVLQPQALFIVTAEAGDAYYQRQPSGRFTHSQDYIEKTARAAELRPLFYRSMFLRMQHNKKVAGHLYIFT